MTTAPTFETASEDRRLRRPGFHRRSGHRERERSRAAHPLEAGPQAARDHASRARGRGVDVTARLIDRIGRPVRRSGISVSLDRSSTARKPFFQQRRPSTDAPSARPPSSGRSTPPESRASSSGARAPSPIPSSSRPGSRRGARRRRAIPTSSRCSSPIPRRAEAALRACAQADGLKASHYLERRERPRGSTSREATASRSKCGRPMEAAGAFLDRDPSKSAVVAVCCGR